MSRLFMDGDDFYSFDGSVPTPIGSLVEDWFSRDLSQPYAHLITGTYDEASGVVYWYYPSTASILARETAQVWLAAPHFGNNKPVL